MTALPYDALLCDVDGVLRHWDTQEHVAQDLEHRYVLPAGTIHSVALDPERLRPAVLGRVTAEEWFAGVARALLPFCGTIDRASAVVEEWSRGRGRIDEEVLDLLATARKRVPVALVSNATTRLEQDLRVLGVEESVDLVVNSARLGMAKPDPGIYLAAAERLGVAPGRCLFVDDRPENVRGAEEVGMTGVLFTGLESLQQALVGLVF
ncbi:HAD family phosphatase [Carbonactinospora thermoautotrophica]|uniref:Putative hydrolase n=1 Tax=Carbonactinospora thermoautotrophica TaxID=1469144 RepID=A0A132NHZ7_9ACTN|nr:HAD family phosphatase [Carbonactinospora thermoautotrophica]KWW99653.1 putative hydrolase [Carbonactinospora thermoautotrophica]KWX03978.1 hypothetical protein TH66_08415 [Carbonactinospora thermoautotrophica]KWX09714.1 hypothetical protein TR74_07915 [Carbonactinospora thermoautotrophica]MCX9191780.1 HAD family phosphatase [Carbonactinospora thermoautotrophica]